MACFLLLSVVIVGSRPAAAVSGTLEVAYSGLDWPVAFAFAPDGRIFFVERYTGNIRIIQDGVVLPDPFYTITGIASEQDQGLLGLALHPSFSTDPWVYAYYTFNDTVNQTVYNRIVRIYANGNVGGSLEVIMDRIPAAGIHIGGVIKFGLDGMLYALVGDNFNRYNSQNLSTLTGKVLRMNPDGSVPYDNPFYGYAGVNPYIYVYGIRNAFGIAFHPTTGRVFITENGPECNDEVDLLIPGRNFGWGPAAVCSTPPPPPNNTNQDGPNPVMPLTWYTPPIAPTNAIIYDGPTFPSWRGDLFFGDWNKGQLHRIQLGPPNYDTILSQEVILTEPEYHCCIIDVQVGPDGAIWFSTAFKLYRLFDTSVPPIASFTVSPPTPIVGESVTFNASASSDPDGSITSYAWDFGDGQSASGAIVAHAYLSYGVFQATLLVTDNDSLTASRSVSIRVLATPTASFAFDPSRPVEGTPVTFNASGSSDPDGNLTEYRWSWGEGSYPVLSGSPVSVHTFATFGDYLVNLTVTDSDGLTNATSASVHVFALPTAAFTVSPVSPTIAQPVSLDGSTSSDPDGVIVLYAWDFGDQTTGSGPTVEHQFSADGNYFVSLTVTDSDGFTDTASDIISVRPLHPPVASFTASATLVSPGDNVAFNASGSSDLDGTIVEYAWDFGDRATDTGMTTNHAYTTSGLYPVTLTVVDDSHLQSSASQDVLVDAPPVAAFTVSIAAPFTGDTVEFNGSASRDLEGALEAFAWDFGDNTPGGAGQEVSHVFGQPGTYRVTLRVTDSVGQTDTTLMNVVARQNEPPVASFAITPVRVNPGESVTFNASSSSDPDGSIALYSWDFGDGTTEDGAQVIHAYAKPGLFSVLLTVTDDRGASDAAAGEVRVNAPPVAAFAAAPEPAYPGLPVTFNASASADPDSPIASYTWDFGDGTTAEGIVVIHTYGAHGTFVVRLVVTDDLGAHDEATTTIAIGNRAPAIESASPESPFVVNTSESATFHVDASDPDGDALTYAWTVDGVPVGASVSSYEFVSSDAGTFEVKVVVSDGATSVGHIWVVEVRERAVPQGFPETRAMIIVGGTAVGATLVVIALVALMMRRRRSR